VLQFSELLERPSDIVSTDAGAGIFASYLPKTSANIQDLWKKSSATFTKKSAQPPF
jgi:hypothetical protein